MAGQYENALTIQESIEMINRNEFLLPAIQRKFVWSSDQICVLFDSIMRDFPINSFMFWEVKEDRIKSGYRFYQFLKCYCTRFNEENPKLVTSASFGDFKAVIDGQQRLTSLYIGLCGTYAYKNPRVHWPSTLDENKLPARKLYLDLASRVDRGDDESLVKYRFKFLTDKQFEDSQKAEDKNCHWFCMHDLLNFPNEENPSRVLRNIVMPYLQKCGLANNEFSVDTLSQLYDVIRKVPVIHYFKETSQDIDHVLDVFIRTNSGGTKLDFSDLLMSIAVANWKGDFRKEVDSLVKEVHGSKEMGFYLGRDWVLKTCLMLTEADVKFKVKNFKADQVSRIQENWGDIKDCIRETFKLVRRFGLNPESLTSRNAVIPVCYYLYSKASGNEPLYRSINNLAKVSEERGIISKWLYMALLKGVFGGQADTILSSMRNVINEHIKSTAYFPLEQVIEKYKGSNKDLRFSDEYLDNLLDTQHGEGRCRVLLHLLFPEMSSTEIYHIDHLHAKSKFERYALKSQDFLKENKELMEFYIDPLHWNGMANLHLLNYSQNLSKQEKPLSEWIGSSGVTVTKQSLLLGDNNVSLGFSEFREFYRLRRSALKARLVSRVYMTDTMTDTEVDIHLDEEVIDEDSPFFNPIGAEKRAA